MKEHMSFMGKCLDGCEGNCSNPIKLRLITKLANEAGKKWKEPIPQNAEAFMPFEDVWRHAYEAGFRKALELAAEKASQLQTEFEISGEILSLGESEVK